MSIKKFTLFLLIFIFGQNVHALIIIPIPNLGFPPIISKTRDALEKSSETKALATVGEDKTFGSRMWAYGDASGSMTQADADAQALRKCESMLQGLKSQTKGGQPLYDFGSNKCELYKFVNASPNIPEPPPVSVAAPASPAAQDSDIVQKMKSLETLLKEKLISQEEFDAKKKQLLNGL
jgi:hypothetical protein